MIPPGEYTLTGIKVEKDKFDNSIINSGLQFTVAAGDAVYLGDINFIYHINYITNTYKLQYIRTNSDFNEFGEYEVECGKSLTTKLIGAKP